MPLHPLQTLPMLGYFVCSCCRYTLIEPLFARRNREQPSVPDSLGCFSSNRKIRSFFLDQTLFLSPARFVACFSEAQDRSQFLSSPSKSVGFLPSSAMGKSRMLLTAEIRYSSYSVVYSILLCFPLILNWHRKTHLG